MTNMITIQTDDGKLTVESPYHPGFPSRAKQLGGRWVDSTWIFDARHETRVRALLHDVYGTDGTETETVTLHVTVLNGYGLGKDLYVAGRKIAHVYDRDGGARLGDDCAVISGELSSGGSRKNPRLSATEGAVVEVLDVPVRAAREAVAAESSYIAVQIVACDAIDRDALQAERTQLEQRIAEIDATLAR